MELCDSHGHIQMLEGGEREAVLERAAAAGVAAILVPGTTLSDSRLAVELAESRAGLHAAVGVHPHETAGFDADRVLPELSDLCESKAVVAVGEIGLDFHYDHSPRQDQIRAFESQLDFAAQRGLPVLLHNRESGLVMLEILRGRSRRERPGLFHSFTESAQFGLDAIALGYKISFSGMITFKAADNIRRAAAALPLDDLLVETDAPFLSPVPHRGKPCEPAFVIETARKLAQVQGVSLEDVGRATTATFRGLFFP